MKFWWLVVIIVGCVGFDQLTKRWAQSELRDHREQFQIEFAGACDVALRKQFPSDPPRRIRRACADQHSQTVVRPVVDVIPGYFEFEYAENRGAAFGTFGHDAPKWARVYMHVGSIVGLLFFILLTIAFARVDRRFLAFLACCCVAGAIGNIWDRIRLGYVIDFVLWRVGDVEWPIFNVADTAVSIGFFGLLIFSVVEVFRVRRFRLERL